MAQICLILSGKTLAENTQTLQHYAGDYDLVEIRADFLDPDAWDYLNRWGENLPCPSILTLRLPEDGGRFEGGAPARRAFFEKAVQGPWTYLDIEEAHPLPDHERAFLARGKKVIRSLHDFHGIPRDLESRLKALNAPGRILKAAVTVNSTAELNQFLQLTQKIPGSEKVLLAMGPFGLPTRLLAEKLGSLWTYGVPRGPSLAPGQIDVTTMNRLYRVREVKKESPVYGIVGNPVSQSKSPRIHNPALAQVNGGIYLPFLTDSLKDFWTTADLLKIRGVSVTIPFKEEAAAALGKNASPRVQTIGACNTLHRTQTGAWMGENTDAPGFLAPLLGALGTQSLKNLPVAVIGTGGAARGVIYALSQAGSQVLVLGRTPEKVQTLAIELGVQGAPLSSESLEILKTRSRVIVQTTSAGMGAQAQENPLDWYPWTGNELAYDIIYEPEQTLFLQAAQKAGGKTLNGYPMLWEQAYRQFELFTGQKYPESLKLPY